MGKRKDVPEEVKKAENAAATATGTATAGAIAWNLVISYVDNPVDVRALAGALVTGAVPLDRDWINTLPTLLEGLRRGATEVDVKVAARVGSVHRPCRERVLASFMDEMYQHMQYPDPDPQDPAGQDEDEPIPMDIDDVQDMAEAARNAADEFVARLVAASKFWRRAREA
eukprot:jgi/Tetstr1/447167/TSEL_034604.t1